MHARTLLQSPVPVGQRSPGAAPRRALSGTAPRTIGPHPTVRGDHLPGLPGIAADAVTAVLTAAALAAIDLALPALR